MGLSSLRLVGAGPAPPCLKRSSSTPIASASPALAARGVTFVRMSVDGRINLRSDRTFRLGKIVGQLLASSLYLSTWRFVGRALTTYISGRSAVRFAASGKEIVRCGLAVINARHLPREFLEIGSGVAR